MLDVVLLGMSAVFLLLTLKSRWYGTFRCPVCDCRVTQPNSWTVDGFTFAEGTLECGHVMLVRKENEDGHDLWDIIRAWEDNEGGDSGESP